MPEVKMSIWKNDRNMDITVGGIHIGDEDFDLSQAEADALKDAIDEYVVE